MGLRIIAFLLLLLLAESSNAQKNSGNHNKKAKVANSTILDFDSSFLANKGMSAIELFIHDYVDSLNNLKNSGVFPSFLEDPQFDYRHSGWSPSHSLIPFRKMIVSRVTNCKSLRMILESKNETYKIKPRKEHEIDVKFSGFSFYELVADRYNEMNCAETY